MRGLGDPAMPLRRPGAVEPALVVPPLTAPVWWVGLVVVVVNEQQQEYGKFSGTQYAHYRARKFACAYHAVRR